MKKWIISIVVACILLAVGLSFFTKQTISAQNVILSNQLFTADLSTAINQDAWEKGEVYLLNQKENKVNAQHKIAEDGKSIEISGLEEGAYTLFVKKKLGIGKARFMFHVYKEIQSIQSKQELTDYFTAVQKVIGDMNIGVMEEAETTSESKDSATAEGGGDYSTTNNQVEGVDEADSVKTNGTHIFTLSDNKVVIINVEDPANLKEETKLQLDNDFYPTQLLLSGETLMVIGQKNMYHTLEKGMNARSMEKIGMPMDSMTTVYFYDISNPTSPKLEREIATEGYLNGARLTNNTLYYVTTFYPNYWGMEEDSKIELRPHTFDSMVEGAEVTAIPYKDIAILPNTMQGSYSVITAIDLENLAENAVITKGYLGGSEQLYMSKENLYLTAGIYESEDLQANTMIWNSGTMNTEVFKFALEKTNIQFVTSSRITGSILNQFSMDEHNGYFRAVTTKGNNWNDNEPAENNLFILDEGMNIVGSLTGLAKEERIYSARFMGDKAYMVTFKETDPLFVIDVATPTAPKVLGELKIPGFSNYLHPLDETHLIGFGYETKSVAQSGSKEPIIMTEGMKVSLFDVTDFENPKELDTEIIGGQGTYSPIQYDHHALFEHSGKNLYGFPISVYEQSESNQYTDFKQDGALIYEITPENGIILKGNLLKQKTENQQYEEWEKSIQRMTYVENTLFTIAMQEIISYNLNTFEQISKLTY
ncbi:putative secreted protein with C-terminal beta-propeller domain [Psychrobacillus insolitus]|uniref:Putative secreted protein with C-terminal beta-propeller domain n=1 Tax=Psychrobacillus insolitus TaxID=1461 RepID=A0A2W7MIT6_9BACI|nr:beta-propeller domain-containing protein [Psychrobacillus insolitus]PZX05769.1 putative secreted protein with C-terminal beta-propeller domain [Psychrobacillus insolitus]